MLRTEPKNICHTDFRKVVTPLASKWLLLESIMARCGTREFSSFEEAHNNLSVLRHKMFHYKKVDQIVNVDGSLLRDDVIPNSIPCK